MAQTFEELRKRTVAELREIAKDIDHEALKGHTQMHKADLLMALCTALHIKTHGHHDVAGINKTELKAKIKEYKKKRDEALAAHDPRQLKAIRRDIHRLRRMIRRGAV
jgi:NTP pyrophosphatase (non-canonical NTP hydrolase)